MNRERVVEKALQRYLNENKSVTTQGFVVGKLAKEIIESLSDADNLFSEVVSLGDDERKESERHNNAKTQLRIRLEQIRAKCKHVSTTYYPDASGNNDSHTSCDICGKEVQRIVHQN